MTFELKGALVAFCNPLLDITANVSDEFLLKYGLDANNAIIAEEGHLPLYEELVKKYQVLYTAGGSAQNTMRAAQWLLPTGSTVFVGCIGRDPQGQTLRQVAEADGLQVEYLEDEETPTGTCAVLVTQQGKCRSLVANLAAANKYKIDHVKSENMQNILHQSKCIYISGYFLTVAPDAIMEIVSKSASKQERIICLNLSAPFICQFFNKQLFEVLPFVDYLFGNESEALALAQTLGLGTTDVAEIARHISKMPKIGDVKERKVIFTQGALPTIVAYKDGIEKFPVDEIPDEDILDTNGAGDAFVGGFLSQLVQERSLSACVNAGHYAASIIIRTLGVVFPTRPNLTIEL